MTDFTNSPALYRMLSNNLLEIMEFYVAAPAWEERNIHVTGKTIRNVFLSERGEVGREYILLRKKLALVWLIDKI